MNFGATADRDGMRGETGHFNTSGWCQGALLRKRQQSELESIELLTSRAALAIVHCRRTDLNSTKGGDVARPVGCLFVGCGVLGKPASAVELDRLDGFTRSSLASWTKLNQGHKTLLAPLDLAIVAHDVCRHVHSEAFDFERDPTLGLADEVALHVVSPLALAVLKVEADIDLEIVSTVASPLAVDDAEALMSGRAQLAVQLLRFIVFAQLLKRQMELHLGNGKDLAR